HEMLERRELFAADLVGIARGANQILLNTDNDSAHEIDQSFGVAGDMHLAGDWNGTGHDNVGVVRNGADGFKHWYLDTNTDPLHEVEYLFGFNSDTPVVGDWDGVGGDNVGIVRNGRDGLLHWYLDTNGDPNFEVEYAFGLIGDTPVTGDWNGDGKTDVGVVRPGADGTLRWHMNWDNDVWPEDGYAFGLNGDRPVVGDWDGDGKDDVGAVRTNQWGFLNWYLNTDRDTAPERQIDFGARRDTPLVGKWDAPEFQASTSQLSFGSVGQNAGRPLQSFTITNDGNATLYIRLAEVPQGFELVTSPPKALAPGQSAPVTVAMKTNRAGKFSGSLAFHTNDGNEILAKFGLRGEVTSPPAATTSFTSPQQYQRGPATGDTCSATDLHLGQIGDTSSPVAVSAPMENSEPFVVFECDNPLGSFVDNGQVQVALASPKAVFESEGHAFAHQIGRADGDGWSVNVTDRPNQFLSYGPYAIDVSPGRRTALFSLQIDNNSADQSHILTIDVVDASSGRVLAQRQIHRNEFNGAFQYQAFSLSFDAAPGQRLEFRTLWHGGAYVKQDKVVIL
ncbi:MAG: choice-of-anchor D domain-containing protein, partial [Planctomycetales bacterium]|nr:choice-of-anchor D domain-containing protein [Planctomycetales bacterium]